MEQNCTAMQKPYFNPTAEQTFEIIGEGAYDFSRILSHAAKLQIEGLIEEACNERFQAFQCIAELIPESEEMNLEWMHGNTRSAMEIIFASAIDHFLIGDFEMSAAMLEMLLDLDPEDHQEATTLLAFDYVAMGEYDSFDEIINDISDKHASRQILMLWSSFRQHGSLPQGEITGFRSRFALYFDEFTAESHPVDEAYIKDIESQRPSQKAQARELWLQTENLWAQHPDFITALRTLADRR